LNSLTDKLNALTVEQSQLRKELRSRKEYVDKINSDIEQAHKEAAAAQKKNTALKIQHESVKVPKVEDYIAQKAEMFELQKAAMNWKRKVEIAAGHVAVMKQQMISISKKQKSDR
jgi:predicted RNase H-like nuclease (RuvC/YqgF family)